MIEKGKYMDERLHAGMAEQAGGRMNVSESV